MFRLYLNTRSAKSEPAWRNLTSSEISHDLKSPTGVNKITKRKIPSNIKLRAVQNRLSPGTYLPSKGNPGTWWYQEDECIGPSVKRKVSWNYVLKSNKLSKSYIKLRDVHNRPSPGTRIAIPTKGWLGDHLLCCLLVMFGAMESNTSSLKTN